ncbi:MAG: hypothetical protein ABIB97_02100 [Patescibacteria group bacterium]
MRRGEVPSEVKEQIANETEGTPEIDPAALAEAVEGQVVMEQYAKARMAEQLGPQQEAVKGLLDELDIDAEGRTPEEVGDEVEEKVSSALSKLRGAAKGKFGKTVKTVVLAAMVLGVAAGVATAAETGSGYEAGDEDQPEEGEGEEEISEAGEEIAPGEQAEAEPTDLDVEAVKSVIGEYIPQMGEIDGLTQEEGKVLLDNMIKAGIASAETHGQETRFRASCDQMIEYAKYMMENEDNPDLRVKSLQYGLEQMVNEVTFRSAAQTEIGEEGLKPPVLESEAAAKEAERVYEPITIDVERLESGVDIDEDWLWDNIDKVFEKDGKLLVVKSMTSGDFQIAVDRATMQARGEIAKYQGGVKTPDGNLLYDTNISSASVTQVGTQEENGRHRAVVLMEIPVTERAEADTMK